MERIREKEGRKREGQQKKRENKKGEMRKGGHGKYRNIKDNLEKRNR